MTAWELIVELTPPMVAGLIWGTIVGLAAVLLDRWLTEKL